MHMCSLAQADMTINLSLYLNFMHVKGRFYITVQSIIQLFPKLDSSKLKEIADANFKFDVNGRKFFKRVENTAGKGEIAR